MKATLPSGQKIQVGVKHTTDVLKNIQLTDPKDLSKVASYCVKADGTCEYELRSTHVRLTLEDGTDFAARSITKPPDQFCKRVGRRLAANRLLQNIREILPSKADRRTIFKMICPEYKQTNSRKARKMRQKLATTLSPDKLNELIDRMMSDEVVP